MTEDKPLVNAWTEWGPPEEVVVGRIENACFCPENMEIQVWQIVGYQPKDLIAEANVQIDSLIEILQGESIHVNRTDKGIYSMVDKSESKLDWYKDGQLITKCATTVKRPEIFDFNRPITSPIWHVGTMGNYANPRDVMVTIGNVIIEAPMSDR